MSNLTTLVEYRGTREFKDSRCTICNTDENVKVFGVQSYATEPNEFLGLCKKHEIALRTIGTGAFHFKTLAIEILRDTVSSRKNENN